MSVSHHPFETTLAAYAAGGLSEGAAMVVEAHVAACPACRRTVGLLEAVGGALIEDLAPSALAADALERALAGLDRPTPPAIAAAAPARRRWLAPGVWLTPLRIAGRGGERVYRLQAPPGRRLPRHSHRGREFIQVLSGAFRDESGLYRPGDFAEADASHEHHPLIEGDVPCVCLIWTEGPIRMRDPIGRVLQPWLGI